MNNLKTESLFISKNSSKLTNAQPTDSFAVIKLFDEVSSRGLVRTQGICSGHYGGNSTRRSARGITLLMNENHHRLQLLGRRASIESRAFFRESFFQHSAQEKKQSRETAARVVERRRRGVGAILHIYRQQQQRPFQAAFLSPLQRPFQLQSESRTQRTNSFLAAENW